MFVGSAIVASIEMKAMMAMNGRKKKNDAIMPTSLELKKIEMLTGIDQER